MFKIFTNVWPVNYRAKAAEFIKQYIINLLTSTEVKTPASFDYRDVVGLMLLDQSDRLQESLQKHGVKNRIGLFFNTQPNYYGWTLIVESGKARGSINPLVSKFFQWEKAETQSILSFNEMLNM